VGVPQLRAAQVHCVASRAGAWCWALSDPLQSGRWPWRLRVCPVHARNADPSVHVQVYFAGHEHHQAHLDVGGIRRSSKGRGGRSYPPSDGEPLQRFGRVTHGFAWVRVTEERLPSGSMTSSKPCCMRGRWLARPRERSSSRTGTGSVVAAVAALPVRGGHGPTRTLCDCA